MAKVKDVIKGRRFVTVNLNTPVRKISNILMEKKLVNVPVVNGDSKLHGVVSERDIIKSLNSTGSLDKKAKDIMTKNVVYVKENDALEKVARIFTEKPLRKLPVVKKGKVIGVITRDDIISSFMKYY